MEILHKIIEFYKPHPKHKKFVWGSIIVIPLFFTSYLIYLSFTKDSDRYLEVIPEFLIKYPIFVIGIIYPIIYLIFDKIILPLWNLLLSKIKHKILNRFDIKSRNKDK